MFNKTKKWGFTLVEVLIVIIIVGILIAALLPRLTGSQARARDVSRTAGVNQVANGLSLLINDQGTINTWASCATTINSASGATATLWDYLSSVPLDPQTDGDHDGVGVACTDGYLIIPAADWRSALVVANMEADGGNAAAPTANPADLDTEAEMQAYMQAGWTDYFAVYIRG